MVQPHGGGQPAVDVAVVAVPLLVVTGVALALGDQHRRYGLVRGWSGRLTMAFLLSCVGVVAYAVWPLPALVDGLCSPSAGSAPPGPDDRPHPAHAPRELLLGCAVLIPVGFLARDRFRRGLGTTLALGVALATAASAVRATGLLGVYPCAYATTSPLVVGLGVVGVLLGWAVARWLSLPRPGGLARGWPSAVADRAAPEPSRRALACALDLGLWWYGAATLAALARLFGLVAPAEGETVRTLALLGTAVVLGLVVPLLRRDRCTPAAALLRLALSEREPTEPAARRRVLSRALLLHAPVVALVALGWPWFACAVAVLHVSTALVRKDRAGLADLVCGVRVRTRSTLHGGLPDRLVRYRPPLPEPGEDVTSTPGSPGAGR
ncbi:antibiotic resistance protein VanZ [Nocardiopsis sp. CNR-923]|uniref:RDD family protein n=1 Tax=Nocardiopsis sp. CNR-923 TaxID=1904965 RepID=UPI000961F2A8|nr:RDD family protein [Nocardiopsis sp. CNR-923]OLT26732.1 antibiotic resistance protein VanZ [Nocardiopsis sp. CNR-923]